MSTAERYARPAKQEITPTALNVLLGNLRPFPPVKTVPAMTALPIQPALEGRRFVSAIKGSRDPTVECRAAPVLLEHTPLHTDRWSARHVRPEPIQPFHQRFAACVQGANLSEQVGPTPLMPALCVPLANFQR